MSSSQPTGTAGDDGRGGKGTKEKKGLGRMLSRVKTVLKRDGASKRASTVAPTQPTIAEDTARKQTGTETVASPEVAPPVQSKSKAAEARARHEATEGVSKHSKSQLLEERAKKLSEQFGLELDLSGWRVMDAPEDDTIFRTDKTIRMRVRRNCHKCNALFVTGKECSNCQHVRCTKCPRYPPKLNEEDREKSRARRAELLKSHKENAPIIPDWRERDTKEIVLTRPARNNQQDLVFKRPRQRVRRTCHECATLFASGSKQCAKCDHVRCTDCPRDPAKKDKYPFGYPGDVFGPNSVPYYECEGCKNVYPAGAENGHECKNCGQPKTDESKRARPRKVEPEPDPEAWARLQARFEAMDLAHGRDQGQEA